MALNPRLTIFFSDGAYGWSETHWSSNTSEGLDQTILNGIVLANARINLCGFNPIIKEIRASYDDTFRDSKINVFNPPLNSNFNASGTGGVPSSDLPYSITLLRAESGILYRKSLYLSGVPDDLQLDPTAIYGALWMTNFQIYRQALLTGSAIAPTRPWGFKVLKKPPDVPTVNITNVVFGTPVVVTSAGHPFNVGQRIHIRLVKQTPARPSVNHLWYISATTANTFTLNGSNIPGGTYLGGGIAYDAQTYDIKAYTDVLIVRETHRNRGRPFDSPRGRRRRAA